VRKKPPALACEAELQGRRGAIATRRATSSCPMTCFPKPAVPKNRPPGCDHARDCA